MENFEDLLYDIVNEIKNLALSVEDIDSNSKEFNPSYEFGKLFICSEILEIIKMHATENGININNIGFVNFNSYELLNYRPKGWDIDKNLID